MVQLTLWEWLARRGYTGRHIADVLGYTEWYVSRVKNGRVPITGEFVQRCVIVFGPEVRQYLPNQDERSEG